MIIYIREEVSKDKRAEALSDALCHYCAQKGLVYEPDERNHSRFSFEYGKYGKPYLPGKAVRSKIADVEQGVSANTKEKKGTGRYEEIHFSVSHSGRYWVAGIHESPVGVDVEDLKLRSKPDEKLFKIAGRFFSDAEASYANTAGRFYEVWTRKEAYIKYLGTGMSEGLKTFSVINDKDRQVSKIGEACIKSISLTWTGTGMRIFHDTGDSSCKTGDKGISEAVLSWCMKEENKRCGSAAEREVKIIWQRQEHMQQELLFQES